MPFPRRAAARVVSSLVAGGLLSAAATSGLPAQAELTDSQLRAAFLFRFGQYVDWPAGSKGASTDEPLVIGVYGDPALVDDLGRMVSGRQIAGRSVEVRTLDRPDDLDDLAIVFVGTDDALLIGRALRAARDRGILTVGDTDGFAERGGMVNFFREERKMRFEVNVAATGQSGIRLSSQLLRLARIVNDSEARP